jgi:hypothetical protein
MAPANVDEVMSNLRTSGITDHDAIVIADCILNRQSCSWVNTDPVDEGTLAKLNAVVAKFNYPIKVKVDIIATRGKWIWDVKANK